MHRNLFRFQWPFLFVQHALSVAHQMLATAVFSFQCFMQLFCIRSWFLIAIAKREYIFSLLFIWTATAIFIWKQSSPVTGSWSVSTNALCTLEAHWLAIIIVIVSTVRKSQFLQTPCIRLKHVRYNNRYYSTIRNGLKLNSAVFYTVCAL